MKKRLTAWIVLLVLLFSVLPVAYAAGSGPVEDFTVEKEEGGISVTLPEGYAASGFFKLFWKNETTGEIRNDVFPVDTPSYRIETEEGAEYSFQLYYSKLRGKLPSAWKEEQPAAETGPVTWKVLWIDASTVDFRGITNQLSDANTRASEETARAYEALAEEMAGGRVDLEITRMTLDEPITELDYYPERGYCINPDNFNMKHYALRKYDSVFIFARMDHILVRYTGITFETENPKEYPGYSFIPLVGEDNVLLGGYDVLGDVCVHEWIHQLGYLYNTYHLEIPDPDEPEKYGYSDDLDHGLFRDALTMTAVSEDGHYIGVPAEAWEYRPTKYAHRNLSALQEKKAPATPAPRQEEPSPAETPAEEASLDVDPAVLGTLDEETGTYTNTVMGLSFAADDWYFYNMKELPFPMSSTPINEDDSEVVRNDNSMMLMFSANSAEPSDVSVGISTSAVPFVRKNGVEAYLLERKKLAERWASQNGCEDVSCELAERVVAGRTLPALRFSYVSGGVEVRQETLAWLNGDVLNIITADAFMFDLLPDVMKHFRWLDN
ncbi:MAG: hypothetical protein IKG87_13870 [Clostridia bacterium]|nr:hypothetical protein [Clostridia bacterium]MBR4576674.1 hypothetical protein [Clostridia bacterium]